MQGYLQIFAGEVKLYDSNSMFYSEGNENKAFKQRNTMIKAIALEIQFGRDVKIY